MKILAPTILLAFTISAPFAWHAAAAQQLGPGESLIPAVGPPTPDGKFGHPYQDRGVGPLKFALSNWGGKTATDSTHNFKSVEAYVTVPTNISCNSTGDFFGPWVGLNGVQKFNTTIQQVGVAISCATGVPTFQGFYEMYPADAVYISTTTYPIAAGDVMIMWVTNTSGSYSLNLEDNGPNNTSTLWHFAVTKAGPSTAASAEAVIESPAQKYANFHSMTFYYLGGACSPACQLFQLGTGQPPIQSSDAGYGTTTEATASGIDYSMFTSPDFIMTYVQE